MRLRDAASSYEPCKNCRPPVYSPVTTQPLQQQKPKDNGDVIVYATKTGAKYHKTGCSSLRKSSIPLKLRDAVAKGLTPCAICKPPVLQTAK
jgi:competence protein ComEC